MTEDLASRVVAAREWLDSIEAAAITTKARDNIQRWLERPAYRDAWPDLLALIEARDTSRLTSLFWERIPFGTGGRRGPMATIGSATINARTIAESAWGLGEYVQQNRPQTVVTPTPQSSEELRAVVACDARLRSTEFAQVTARVLAAAGFTVYLYREPRATPQLSFSVRRLGCHCGVMISASHNPPGDNGFKAYWSDGCQVLPPHDGGIIACVDSADEIPLADLDAALSSGQIRWVDAEVDRDYVNAVASLSLSSQRSIRALYTPLHGVGESSVARVVTQAGFEMDLFEPQRSMDGTFPNVPNHLPNPEQTAVFVPAASFAASRGYDLILASDPDADRMAIAVRTPEGRYDCLSGNQLGALLTDYVLRKRWERNELTHDHYVVETLVTTRMIATIAESYGVTVVRDLPVGFKFIGQTMETRGVERFVFGAEESLGYLAGGYCRDKDAAVAALWCLELAAELKAEGLSLNDQLHRLYVKHGYHREAQISRTFKGPTGALQIAQLMAAFRSHPPVAFGEIPLQRVRDYGRHEIRNLPANRVSGRTDVAAGDLLMVEAEYDGIRLEIGLRPSGTEPKIKFYFAARAYPSIPVGYAESRSLDVMKAAQAGLEDWIETIAPGRPSR